MMVSARRQAAAWFNARPYLTLAALIVLATAMRAGLTPILHDKQPFSLYLPLVVMTSYLFGARRAAMATAVTAVLGYLLFAGALEGAAQARATAPGVFLFVMNCAAVIYVVGSLKTALNGLTVAQGESEAMANAHAELFREVNQRITHHLRLVAGVLALQAKGEPEPVVSAGLKKAAERSMQISRAHAELAGEPEAPVQFTSVAERIVRTLLSSRGEAPDRVVLEPGHDLILAPEAATALAAALLECLGSLLNLDPPGEIRVRVISEGRRRRVEVCVGDTRTASQLRSLAEGYLLRAVVEQLGAGIDFRREGRGGVVQLAFDADERPRETFREQTLH